MAIVTKETITPIYANTTLKKVYHDGIHKLYEIEPCENYVLHDKDLDSYMEYDEEGNGIGEPTLGFYAGTKTVRYDYDFTANPRGFYAVLESDVPEGAEIFNIPSGDHEII